MKLKYYFKLSFRNLFRRKFRNIFTVIALCIAAILLSALLALQSGFSGFLKEQLSFLPADDIVRVNPKSPDINISFTGPTSSKEPVEVKQDTLNLYGMEIVLFKKDDIEKIKKVSGVAEVDYEIDLATITKAIQLVSGGKKYVAITAYNSIETKDKLKIVAGRDLQKNDQGVGIISAKYQKVFGADKPDDLVGKMVIIDGQQNYSFQILGVSDNAVSENPDFVVGYEDAVQMARDDYGNPELYKTQFGSGIKVKVKDKNQISDVDKAIEKLGFESTTAEEISQGISGAVEWFFRVLAIIGFVISALFIFTTMSVAVKDRTREIGIMKAVGATKGTIRILFSTEAIMIGFGSGILASILSLGWFSIINFYTHQTFLKDLPTVNILPYNTTIPLIVIAVTTFVSLFSAFWPAFRASNIDPIRAIKNE